MAGHSLSIDDCLAEASPVLGRMRLDGLTETAVPFAEPVVLLWRRGTPTPDMGVNVLIDVLKVRPVCASVHSRCARCAERGAVREVPCQRGGLAHPAWFMHKSQR